MKRMMILLLVVLSVGAVSAQEELRVGYIDYPPYEYQEDGIARGAATEVVREAFKRAGLKVEFVFLPWSRALEMVKKGEIDGLYTALKKPEREIFADYSQEVLIEETVAFFAPADSSAKYTGNLRALGSLRLGLIRNFSYGAAFDGAKDNGVFSRLDYSDTAAVVLRKLVAKRSDIAVADRLGFMDLARQEGVLNQIKEIGIVEATPVYIIFSKANNLDVVRDKIDRALREMKKDGSYAELVN